MAQAEHVTEPYPAKHHAFDSFDTSYSGTDPLLMEPFVIVESPPPRYSLGTTFSARRVLRETWRDVVKDIRAVAWGRGGLWGLFFVWAAGLLVADILIPMLATRWG